MKKLFVVLAILFIGIALAGCTSKPAAPATPAQTTVAVTTPAPVVTKEVIVIKKNETANVTAAPTPVPTEQPSVTITFTQDMTVVPGVTVYVPVGGKVIWKNDDPLKPHGIQAIDNTLGQKYFGGMNTITIPYGKTYEVTFDVVGAYDYTTVFQPQTIGKIIVTK
jgi:plastocyanin